MKWICTSLLASLMFCTNAYASERAVCVGKNEQILVNGENFPVNAYLIDGYNYFKLRDLSYVMQKTNTPFTVKWKDNRIDIVSQTDDNASKPLMMNNQQQKKEAVQTNATVYVNQKQEYTHFTTSISTVAGQRGRC